MKIREMVAQADHLLGKHSQVDPKFQTETIFTRITGESFRTALAESLCSQKFSHTTPHFPPLGFRKRYSFEQWLYYSPRSIYVLANLANSPWHCAWESVTG
ncbi:MAG: hypothetical protein IT423_11875 [Pirellulaceae bacterium]|nr:hypothetical protein [Pirellulaceae bacterium]